MVFCCVVVCWCGHVLCDGELCGCVVVWLCGVWMCVVWWWGGVICGGVYMVVLEEVLYMEWQGLDAAVMMCG